ncbi:hypothetical protein BMF94_3177 [Rhodotorula taiwanensis]|uniref:Uncharacterized protein n=1 Tax=Rhodotorula taiwanensis TaxID=741276 RepID=A0A2S5BA41_9BASI|nr:hypothetical protein BMF94_3177 [Rhodotorula taiwanensis]
MESAALEALDLPESQSQSQPWTQTQTQTQQTQASQGTAADSSRFPSHLWGILVAVTGPRTSSTGDVFAVPVNGRKPNGATLLSSSTTPETAALPRPERLELSRGQNEFVIGRHPKSDLRLNGPKISSVHARIWIDPDTGIIRLEDKGTNGTYVRNSKVGKGKVTVLESGDPIVFGPASTDFDQEFRYIFQCDPSLTSSRTADPYGLGELSQSQSADGTSIHSFYEVREQIGKGSFATVRKGVRRRDGLMVAIKIIQKARFMNNPKTMEMIAREIKIIQTLEHRFCVRCYDYFEDDQRIWLVLEYVDGGDLLDYVMKRRGLKESEVREISLMICEAVAYLHSRGITHRDLKPENLLLTRGEHPVCKVTDFGLAKMANDQTRLTTMCGTPTYLAPEVILNPDPKSGYSSIVDAWSIGVVLWCCLTNQTPFDETESDPLAVRMRTRYVDMSLPKSLGVSNVALDFLRKLLTPDPRLRMSCAQALRHPWLITKGSSDAESIASIPFMCSSLPYNDPMRSVIDSTSNAGEDAVMTAINSGTSPAQSDARMDAGSVAQQDSGVDSQGFGKLALSEIGNREGVSPTSPAADSGQTDRPSSQLAGQKRKEPMSAFSDSSLSSLATSQPLESSPAKMPPPPPPLRKPAPVPRQALLTEIVAETSEEAEPSTAEDDTTEQAAVVPASPTKDAELATATADIALDKPTETPPSVNDAETGAQIDETPSKTSEAAPTESSAPLEPPARRPRASRAAAAKRTSIASGSGARGGRRASAAPREQATPDVEEADAESDAAPAHVPTGIAATVKNRRRKAARYR